MDRFCDLHTHSLASDGSYAPSALISLAKDAGLSAIALTDHNTLAGLPDFLASAPGTTVEAIPGIEFSTDWEEAELHIVALFLRPEHYIPINGLLAEARQRKLESNLVLTENLRKAGFPLSYDRVQARTEGIPNRAHFAAELTDMGITCSIKEAMCTLLSPKNGLYIPPVHPQAQEVIDLIRELGAVSVLAHPFLNLKEPRLRQFLKEVRYLDAMETLYTDFTPEQVQLSKAMAAEFHLKESGGTDFHGTNKPHIHLGDTRVPLDYLEALRECQRL